jgi:hypothetical protein
MPVAIPGLSESRVGNIDASAFPGHPPHPKDVICLVKQQMSSSHLSQLPFMVLPWTSELEEVLKTLIPAGRHVCLLNNYLDVVELVSRPCSPTRYQEDQGGAISKNCLEPSEAPVENGKGSRLFGEMAGWDIASARPCGAEVCDAGKSFLRLAEANWPGTGLLMARLHQRAASETQGFSSGT